MIVDIYQDNILFFFWRVVFFCLGGGGGTEPVAISIDFQPYTKHWH